MFKQFLMAPEEGGAPMGFGGAPIQSAPVEAPAETPAENTVNYNFPETLDEKYRGDSFKKFADDKGNFDYGKIMQSYSQLEQHLGKDKMVIPGTDATPEDWRSTFTKLGLPESIDNYEVKNNLPEGFKANDDLVAGFKAKAFEAGILPNQAQAMLDFYNDFSSNMVTTHNESTQAQIAEGFNNLKQEWGDTYDNRLNQANEALKQFATTEEIGQMNEAGMLSSPLFAKVFDKVAKGLSEDNFTPESKGSYGMDSMELDSAITKTHSKLLSIGKMHPEYQGVMKQYQDLLSKRHGNEPVV